MAKKTRKGGAKPGKQSRKKSTAPASTKTGAAAAKPGAAKPSEVRKLTPASTLDKLLRNCANAKEEMDTINGSMRESIAYAKANQYLHPKAFALLRQFDRMEAERLAEMWDTLNAYMDSTGIMKKIEDVNRLDLGDKPQKPGAGAGAAQKQTDAKPPKAANGGGKPAAAAKEKPAAEPASDAGKVSRPQFGQPVAAASQAPGGPVHMLGSDQKH